MIRRLYVEDSEDICWASVRILLHHMINCEVTIGTSCPSEELFSVRWGVSIENCRKNKEYDYT